MEFLTLSRVNNALWGWLLGLVFITGFSKVHPVWACLILMVPVIASPAALGLITGRLYQGDVIRQLLGRWGFRTVHQIPTAWDYQFGKGKPHWVVVTLKDGSHVYGLYGYRSFAGDDPTERDLYLEAQYRLRDDGEWLPVDGNAAILIKAENIAAVEFRALED